MSKGAGAHEQLVYHQSQVTQTKSSLIHFKEDQ